MKPQQGLSSDICQQLSLSLPPPIRCYQALAPVSSTSLWTSGFCLLNFGIRSSEDQCTCKLTNIGFCFDKRLVALYVGPQRLLTQRPVSAWQLRSQGLTHACPKRNRKLDIQLSTFAPLHSHPSIVFHLLLHPCFLILFFNIRGPWNLTCFESDNPPEGGGVLWWHWALCLIRQSPKLSLCGLVLIERSFINVSH